MKPIHNKKLPTDEDCKYFKKIAGNTYCTNVKHFLHIGFITDDTGFAPFGGAICSERRLHNYYREYGERISDNSMLCKYHSALEAENLAKEMELLDHLLGE